MKVALVTNLNEKCGLAEYGANLYNHCRMYSDDEIKIVQRPFNFEHIYAETRDADLIHFNYSTGEFSEELLVSAAPWIGFRKGGKHLTLTLHDSTDQKANSLARLRYMDGDWRRVFDRVVIHAESEKSIYEMNVQVIPFGILDRDTSHIRPQEKIGTAGFPMPWKGFVSCAFIASVLKLGFLGIMPDSKHVGAAQTTERILEFLPAAELVTDWLPQEQVIDRLAECFVVVYRYDLEYKEHPFDGISGAVRFGLACHRPIVISRHKMFRDLFDYEDEIYITNDGGADSLGKTIVQVVNDWNSERAKKPNRILRDMSWHATAHKYLEMWAQVARCEAITV